MSTDPIERPQPQPTEISAPYWEGLRDGRLLLQTCADCGRIRHYPRPVCDACFSLAVTWTEASGKATVHSWTVAHHAYHPAFKGEVPYVLLTADLEEGVRVMGRLDGDDPSGLRLGLPVRLTLRPTENGYALPAFAPEGAASP